MSVDSNEIDLIMAEDYGETEMEPDKISEAVNEMLEAGPPYIFVFFESLFFVAGDRLEAEVFIDVPKSLGPATLNLVTQGNEELHILTAAKNVSQTNNKIFSINTTLKS